MRIKGFATLFAVIISCVIIVALCSGAFYLLKNSRSQNTEEVSPKALQNDLVKYIQRHNLGSTAYDFSTLEISKRLGSFLRATIFNSALGKTQTIFAVKVDGEWKIAEVVDTTYSCERMTAIGFNNTIVDDCTLSYPEAKKVSDILAIYEKNRAPFQTSIIGTVLVPLDPSCNCLTVSSGGEEVVIYTDTTSSGEYSNFTEGDVVVVTGIVSTDNSGTPDDSTDDPSTPDTDTDDAPNSPDDEDDDVSVDADVIEEVGNDEDDALIPDEDTEDDDSATNDPSGSPSPTDPDDPSGGGNATDPVPEPDSTPNEQANDDPNSGGSGTANTNLYDINKEDQIRLLND